MEILQHPPGQCVIFRFKEQLDKRQLNRCRKSPAQPPILDGEVFGAPGSGLYAFGCILINGILDAYYT